VLLAVDVGNTNICFGLFSGAELRHRFRATTIRSRTLDEYGVLLRDLLSLRGIETREIDGAIVASVVPPITEVISSALRLSLGCEPQIVGPGTRTGISILYDNPREVGADRVVNAVAAFERFHDGVIVVDLGTATTFDCVSPRGEYLGGVIVPGIQVSLDGLLQHAALLSRIEIAEPPHVVGRNTTCALQSGIVHGYASLIDGLVAKLRAELGFPCQVIATGGLAPLIARHAETVSVVDEDLTLVGLQLIYERTSAVKRSR
jgi:type III pantothenate kinase